jgi:arsenate reductase
MEKIKVLFVCVHNSARSQMAEAFINNLAGDKFIAESAGIEPGKLNPYVVKVMSEIGIDISSNRTKDVFEFVRAGKHFNFVITVCEREAAEKCPIFPGISKRLEWSFRDPSKLSGIEDEILEQTRIIREEIKLQVVQWIKEVEI